MKNDEIVSVIIPVYNVEKYISCCIDSIKNQSYPNIELILIDDCSTDHTKEIIEDNIKNNTLLKNIIFLKNSKNMGAGYSRNKGLDAASGKYLVFLDADDFFCSDMIEKLYLESEKANADIAICNCYIFDNKSKKSSKYDITWNCPDLSNIPFKLEDIKDFAFQFIHEIAWNKMFRHEFVKRSEIRFQNQVNANDQFFVFACVLTARRIVKINDYLLYYRIGTANQLSRNISQNPKCIWNATKATFDYINKLNQYGWYKKSFNTYIVNRLMFSLECLKNIEQRNLMEYYQKEGFEKLGLMNAASSDFSIPYSYAKYKYLLEYKQGKNIDEPYLRKLQWHDAKLERLFLNLKERDKLVLWGIGDNGEQFLKIACDYGVLLKNIVDMDKQKKGKKIYDYRINDENSILNGDFILVLNPEHIITVQQIILKQKKEIEILDVRAYLCFEIKFEEAIVCGKQESLG